MRAQIRYLIASEAGMIGGLSFSAPAWRLAARDAWIGWDETGRQAGLSQVVGNSRFLILPGVTVPNLASHVLSLALKRLPADWQARYGVTPRWWKPSSTAPVTAALVTVRPIGFISAKRRAEAGRIACVPPRLVSRIFGSIRYNRIGVRACWPTAAPRGNNRLPHSPPPTGQSRSLAAARCPMRGCGRAC